MKKYLFLTLLSFCAGLFGAFAFYKFSNQGPKEESLKLSPNYFRPERTLMPNSMASPGAVDFVKASEMSRPSVVYIKVISQSQQQSGWDPFFDFFGNVGPVSSSGSGVIISSDGYIATNQHVVANAQKIEVILNNNKRSFAAKVIGLDPSTDLALLKIEAKNLPAVTIANSDGLSVGEWVLAVGNPFNLTSSVTAGIVSAKGRNINIVSNQFPIESFIQTDAAINPGNSGGALMNTQGELVGINTAILSKTGSYAGYGFAIPSNIVRKIISDMKDFGYVQRAFVEAEITDIDARLAEKINEDNLNGVYVRHVIPSGNAAKAGVKDGDIIVKANGKYIDSRSYFDEQLAYHRPGESMPVVVKRGKDLKEINITLTNQNGTTGREKSKSFNSKRLGADFEEINRIEKEKYGATAGVRIFNITNGIIRQMNLPEGFIVTSFNYRAYANPQELITAMEAAAGKIVIEGYNPNGGKVTYSFFTN